jgi:hypothetical protein
MECEIGEVYQWFGFRWASDPEADEEGVSSKSRCRKGKPIGKFTSSIVYGSADLKPEDPIFLSLVKKAVEKIEEEHLNLVR